MKSIKLIVFASIFIFLEAFDFETLPNKNQREDDKTIKIGLLIQDNKSVEARDAAEIAVKKVNAKGGINGRPIELIVRSMEGPWGTGSKQAVDMIFNEKVWAILGSHDGRNAHLVEQVTTKARMLFLSAWASDPTLSQAFVPWYFSCVPNDRQQSEAIISELFNKRKISKVAVISDTGYDSQMASKTFVKTAKKLHNIDPMLFTYDNSSSDFKDLVDNIDKAKVLGIVLLGQSAASIKIIQQIQQRKMQQPIFGSLFLLGENGLTRQNSKNYENVVLVSTGNNMGQKRIDFQREYQKEKNKIPGVAAAYAFDGINLIIEAIRNSGFDREKIQTSLSNIHYEGITGLIKFDEKGNRLGEVALIEIKNGNQVPLQK